MSKASDLAWLITSGSTAIHGEAGVTSSGSTGLTTNLQQGLCKQWCKHTGSGVTVVDTFNTSSVTDSGTGLYAPVFTNNMNNATYTVFCTADDKQDGAGIHIHMINDAVTEATTGYGTVYAKQSSSAYAKTDSNQSTNSMVMGDLA